MLCVTRVCVFSTRSRRRRPLRLAHRSVRLLFPLYPDHHRCANDRVLFILFRDSIVNGLDAGVSIPEHYNIDCLITLLLAVIHR